MLVDPSWLRSQTDGAGGGGGGGGVESSELTVKFSNFRLALSPRIPTLPVPLIGGPPRPSSVAVTRRLPFSNNAIVTDPLGFVLTVASTFTQVLYCTVCGR